MGEWRCPTCGRGFANTNQNHACRPAVPVDVHFDGRPPALRAAFAKVVKALPDAEVVANASSIHFRRERAFAGVRVKKDALDVEFLLARKVASTRILKMEDLGPSRKAHHVRVADPADVDTELVAWLKEAENG